MRRALSLFKLSIFLVLTISSLMLSISAGEVVELNGKNFLETLQTNLFSCVYFFDPGCKNCQAFNPAYDEMASGYGNIKFYKINGAENIYIRNFYQVTHYPAIRLYVSQFEQDYKGPINVEEIKKFLHEKTGVTSKMIDRYEEFQKYINNCLNCVVYNGNPAEESADYNLFENANKFFPDVKFIVINSKEVLDNFGLPPKTKVFMLNNEKVAGALSQSRYSRNRVIHLISKNYVPLITPFDVEGANLIFKNRHFGIVLYSKRDYKGEEHEMFYQWAKLQEGRVKFHIVHSFLEGQYDYDLAALTNITGDMLPCVRFHDARYRVIRSYVYNGAIDVEGLNSFINEWRFGKLKPYVKSEPIPEDDKNPGPIYKLVALNFMSTIKQSETDLIIYFYAPDCEPCSKFDVVYEEFANIIDQDKVKFFKIDETKNAVDSLSVDQVPFIVFISKAKKDAIQFFLEENRSRENFRAFIAQHTSHSDTEELLYKIEL